MLALLYEAIGTGNLTLTGIISIYIIVLAVVFEIRTSGG